MEGPKLILWCSWKGRRFASAYDLTAAALYVLYLFVYTLQSNVDKTDIVQEHINFLGIAWSAAYSYLSYTRKSYKDQSTMKPSPYWSVNPIKTRRVLSKVALFDFRNISNKRFAACLHYFMENDPVCFSILRSPVSTKLVREWEKVGNLTYKHQRTRMRMKCKPTSDSLKRSIWLHLRSMCKETGCEASLDLLGFPA